MARPSTTIFVGRLPTYPKLHCQVGKLPHETDPLPKTPRLSTAVGRRGIVASRVGCQLGLPQPLISGVRPHGDSDAPHFSDPSGETAGPARSRVATPDPIGRYATR